MWLLSFFPDSFILYIINGILFLGIVGSILSFFLLNKILNKIPGLAPYQLLFQIVSAILLVLGIYLKGGHSVEVEWRERVAKVEAELEEARKKSEEVKVVVQERVVTRTRVVKEKADTIIQYVDRPVIQEFDKTCPLPKEAVDVHNEAARMNQAIEELRRGAEK